jgi:hypothetical protein
MTSNTYALVLGLVLIGYTAALALMDRRSSAVVFLHNSAWALALVVVGTGVLDYDGISTTAWVVITGAIAAFNLGSVLGVTAGSARGLAPDDHPRLIPIAAYWVLLALFSIGLALYLLTIARLYGISTLVTDPVSIRGDHEVSYLGSFPLAGKLLFYLGPVCFVLTLFPRLVDGLSSVPLVLRAAVIGYIAVGQIALLQRANLFTSALWALGVYVVATAGGNRRLGASISLRNMVAIVLLCGAAFQVVAVGLGKTGDVDPVFRYSASGPLRDSSVTMVLHYAASGVPAFGALVESHNSAWPPADQSRPLYGSYNPQTWGLATFAPLVKAVPGLPSWGELSPFVHLPAVTNVYTWLEPWYRDFRAPGAILGSLIAGTVVGSVVRSRSGSPTGLLLSGFLVGMSGLATFTNRFSSVAGISCLLSIALLSLIIRAHGRPGSSPGDASAIALEKSGGPR